MKKYIFTIITIAINLNLFAQNKINLHVNNGEIMQFSESDFNNNSDEKIQLKLEDPISSIKEYSFPASQLNNETVLENSQNKLSRVAFLSQTNPAILSDVETRQSGKIFYANIPYLTDSELKNLIANFEAVGKVFVSYDTNTSYILQTSGKSCNDYLNNSCCDNEDFGTLNYIVMDENNNANHYQVCLKNNRLPVLKITGNGSIGSDWKENYMVAFDNSQTSSKIKYSSKNKHYKLNLNDDLNSIYGKTGNRWRLYPINLVNMDKTIIQERIFCSGLLLRLANELIDYSWNPSSYPTELIVNNNYLGSYWLTEEIRDGKNKVNDGIIFELVDKADNDEIFFKTSNGLTCKLHDSELNYEDEKFINSKNLIENFEKELYLQDGNSVKYKTLLDLKSFADWYILHELAKIESESFKSECYLTITDDNKLRMGPLSHFYTQFGNGGESYEGFVLKNHVWFKQLLKDKEFLSLVLERLNQIKSSNLQKIISELSVQMRYLLSDSYNELEHWGKLSSYERAEKAALDFYENWAKKRIEWLDYALNQELNFINNNNPNNQNLITEFSLKQSNNNQALLGDYSATITNDSILIYVPYLVHFDLVPTFSSSGKNVYHNGVEVLNNQTTINFLNEETFTVVAQNGTTRNYIVKIYNSGLPVIYIDTENHAKITSKTTWIGNSTMKVYEKDGKLNYNSGNDFMNIRGRGNSTWDASDKKPYAIKLNTKSEILGLLEDKRWVLLANHYDRSFIRAGLASWLGKRLTKQDWTPSGYSTELVLNGKHVGNYFFCEQIKISDDRVNADYLLEVDTKAKTAGGYDDVYFLSSTTDNVFNIKDPEITTNGSEYNYVQSYINEVEKVLYDDAKYLDSNEGYKKYCDLESFVDWALIKELSKDYDGNFFTSCHMNLTNGILKMGPLWDFDLAFANNPFAELFGGGFGGGWGGGFGGGGVDYEYYNEPEGYHVLEADWLNRMMKDPEFRALLLEKVNLLIEHETEIDQYIDEQAALNINSFVVNETLWKTLGKSSWGWNGSTVEWNYTDATLREHYRNDIAKMKKFIKDRLAWMKNDLQ